MVRQRRYLSNTTPVVNRPKAKFGDWFYRYPEVKRVRYANPRVDRKYIEDQQKKGHYIYNHYDWVDEKRRRNEAYRKNRRYNRPAMAVDSIANIARQLNNTNNMYYNLSRDADILQYIYDINYRKNVDPVARDEVNYYRNNPRMIPFRKR